MMKLIACALGLFSVIASAEAAEKHVKLKPTYLTCGPNFPKPHCDSPRIEIDAGTWDSKRQSFTFLAPAGWHLTGNRAGRGNLDRAISGVSA